MIHPSLIDSARRIKKEYIKADVELKSYTKEVEKLVHDFEEGSKQVKSIADQIKRKKIPVEQFKTDILEVLNGIEDKYKVLLTKVNKIYSDLESLRKQETDLYELIKSRYPSLSDEEIKQQIHESINQPLK